MQLFTCESVRTIRDLFKDDLDFLKKKKNENHTARSRRRRRRRCVTSKDVSLHLVQGRRVNDTCLHNFNSFVFFLSVWRA